MPAMTVPAEEIPAWQLTEDSRYWRAVVVAEARRRNAWPGTAELFRWHSISCVCESCLDTDVVLYAYDDIALVDLKGIQ